MAGGFFFPGPVPENCPRGPEETALRWLVATAPCPSAYPPIRLTTASRCPTPRPEPGQLRPRGRRGAPAHRVPLLPSASTIWWSRWNWLMAGPVQVHARRFAIRVLN
jgi:hypothetical protein